MNARYVHTNLVARNWQLLAAFYQEGFDCVPVPPERDLSGEWLDQATGLHAAHIRGVHLRLPGCGEQGPTLEIFQYDTLQPSMPPAPNRLGYGHVAFAVDDVHTAVEYVVQLGGSRLGEIVQREIPGAGKITFAYLTDPEGNIIEIQHWEKTA